MRGGIAANEGARFTVGISLIVAMGGFLMGFDASVISGVVGFIERDFNLTKLQLGWSVASLTLTATLAMLVAGPLSSRLGRRPVLRMAAVLFAVSAAASAVAPDFASLVIARMIGGLGVGAALIIAPMYIAEMAAVQASVRAEAAEPRSSIRLLFRPGMRLVLTIGVTVAILQAVLVGIVNVVFTVVAILLIDKLGRRPLLGIGLTGIAVCMLTLSYGFATASYSLTRESIEALPLQVDREQIAPLAGVIYDSDVAFRDAVSSAIGAAVFRQHESRLVSAAISINPALILFAILGFVASFVAWRYLLRVSSTRP